MRKLRGTAGELDAANLRAAVDTATGQAKETYVAYTGVVREQYLTLAHRGELVVRRLRRSPEVREAFDKAEELDLGRRPEGRAGRGQGDQARLGEDRHPAPRRRPQGAGEANRQVLTPHHPAAPGLPPGAAASPATGQVRRRLRTPRGH